MRNLIQEVKGVKMIKNIIFDFGNIIVKFNNYDMVSKFTDKEEIKEFLINEVVHSDEWLKKGMIDLGLISLKEMANRINKRTNYKYKNEVYDFSTKFPYELEYNGLNLYKTHKIKKIIILQNNYDENVFDVHVLCVSFLSRPL